MTEDLYHIELETPIADVYNIWNCMDGYLTGNFSVKTGSVRDRMNSEQATLHHVREIGSIVFNSTVEDEDFFLTNQFKQTVVLRMN